MPEPTYRILSADALPSSATTPEPTPETPGETPAPVNDPSESPDVQARAEQQLERIVEEEREGAADEDLLQHDAPRE